MTRASDGADRIEDCRECRAGYAQARAMEPAWHCMDHGTVRLSEYRARAAVGAVAPRRDIDALAKVGYEAYRADYLFLESFVPWEEATGHVRSSWHKAAEAIAAGGAEGEASAAGASREPIDAMYWSPEAVQALNAYAVARGDHPAPAQWERLMLAVKADKERLVAAVQGEAAGASSSAAALPTEEANDGR